MKGVRRMWRRRLVVLVGFGAFLAVPVPAQADDLLDGTDVVATVTSAVDDPVGTITSTTNDVVGTADDVVGTADDAVGTVTSTVTSTASGTADSIVVVSNAVSQTPQETASSSDGSSSGGSDGPASSDRRSGAGSHGDRKTPGRSYHTRFDRLPRRAEILVERIELGRNVRANLRRLEALLRRSPALRAELARAVRSELARLRKDGLTGAERRQVRRLVRIQRVVLAPSVSGSSFTLGAASTPAGSGSPSYPLVGVESTAVSSQDAPSQADAAGAHAQREASGGGKGILGTLPLPDGVDGWPAWVMTLLGVVLWLCILALVAIFLTPFRRAFR